MQFTNSAYLLLGGNEGNRLAHLQQAVHSISGTCGSVRQSSAVYQTAPWGIAEQGAFLNQAIELKTNFSAPDLMRQLLKIEEEMGRKRRDKYGPRIIDLDILLFNEDVIATSDLKIPHAEMQNRRFALQPLADIAPGAMHPVLHKTIRQLLEECSDLLEVNPYSNDEL